MSFPLFNHHVHVIGHNDPGNQTIPCSVEEPKGIRDEKGVLPFREQATASAHIHHGVDSRVALPVIGG